MRLWSMHPRYFDRQALTACWREGLLAQAVITQPGRGYSHHPQLRRFQQTQDPRAAIGDYLGAIVDEADARGYHFAREKIRAVDAEKQLAVNDDQLAYEWTHLLTKLHRRSPNVWERWQNIALPDPHPSFIVIEGPIADWEKVDTRPAAGELTSRINASDLEETTP